MSLPHEISSSAWSGPALATRAYFRRRRRAKATVARIATPPMPPKTPPTIAPTLLFLEEPADAFLLLVSAGVFVEPMPRETGPEGVRVGVGMKEDEKEFVAKAMAEGAAEESGAPFAAIASAAVTLKVSGVTTSKYAH